LPSLSSCPAPSGWRRCARLFVPVDQQPIYPERVIQRSPSVIFQHGVLFSVLKCHDCGLPVDLVSDFGRERIRKRNPSRKAGDLGDTVARLCSEGAEAHTGNLAVPPIFCLANDPAMTPGTPPGRLCPEGCPDRRRRGKRVLRAGRWQELAASRNESRSRLIVSAEAEMSDHQRQIYHSKNGDRWFLSRRRRPRRRPAQSRARVDPSRKDAHWGRPKLKRDR
jgi:hypothetical protein